jgi:hypothetical protein
MTAIRRTAAVIAGAAVVALALPAAAAPTITITSPVDGTSISRAATPSITVSGTVGFTEPVDALRRFNLRRDDCGGDADNPRLSTFTGSDGGDGCGSLLDGVPSEVVRTAGQSSTPLFGDLYSEFAAVDGVPAVLDDGAVTGQLSFNGDGAQAGVGRVEVIVTSSLGEIGRAVVERQMDPAAESTAYPFSVPVPDAMAGQPVEALSLRYVMRGAMVISTGGFLRLNGESYLDLPVRDSGTVLVSTASGFTETSTVLADVAPDGTWSAEVPTPTAGPSRKISARASQGSERTTTAVTVTVTS